MILLAAVLAAVASTASPTPSPAPSGPPLKEIGSVRAIGPYCASFFNHFNAIVHPMVENDVTLGKVGVSLDNLNALFSKPDRENRYYDERLRLEKYVANLQTNTTFLQKEINVLRRGEDLTTDKARSFEMHMLAQELQRALDKQHQMQIDLQNVVWAMFDYNLMELPHLGQPLGDVSVESMQRPKAENDVKDYLRFNGLRDRVRDAEQMAATHAQLILTTYCMDSASPNL